MYVDFWAVGCREFPDKIYASPTGEALIYGSEEKAIMMAEALRSETMPAVSFRVGIAVVNSNGTYKKVGIWATQEVDSKECED